MSKQILDTKEIGQRIKQLRLERGWDQLQLGTKLGISRSQMSNIERGERNIDLNKLKLLSNIFNVSFETLGFQSEDTIDTLDLLERAKLIFLNENVPTNEKQELYDELMKIYLMSKKWKKLLKGGDI